MHLRMLRPVAAALLLALPTVASAQSESDLPDDIFGEDDPDVRERTAGEERADLLFEADQPEVALPAEREKRVIQTLQQKNFMKIQRYEVAPHLGFVTNDPFINRYLVGVAFAYHVTEIFAVEVSGTFSPDLDEFDWKPITHQIIEENQVTPDISKIQFYANVNFQYSPIYGKVAVGNNRIIVFDIFGVMGTGIVNTADDLTALGQDPPEPIAENTQNELHPTINVGGGLRVVFSPSFALRAEGRGVSYIEVLESTTLEMKNNFTLLASASFFFPGMK